MMMRWIWLLLALVGTTAVACNSDPAPPPTLPAAAPPALLQIGVTSSASAIIPLVQPVYAQENPQVELQFVLSNNGTLHNDLANGLLDAILVHHIPEGTPRYFNPVGLDGLVILVHPSNPVQTVTRAEVQAIFNGRITNWQSVGGANEEIVLLSREQGSGLRTLLRQQIMAEQRISPNALLQTGNEAMLTAVANNPAAIGYSSMSSASQSPVKMLPIDGRSATPATTADQTYPLTTPLYFVAATEAEPTGELRAFLAWLQSEAGQGVIEEAYGRVR
ncbi:MAG: substrate-binding domain-containing protein [Anaerolineales bacterium]|nr:substrate-binding domain-containing protein [Anaerolineales bacterium]